MIHADPEVTRTDERPLLTARLRLRLLDACEGDATLYRALYTSAEVMRMVMPPVCDAVADEAFPLACRHNRRVVPGHRFWVIEWRESGARIGIVALQRSGPHAELGALLKPSVWNRGVASEAFAVVLDHAFATWAIDGVDAQTRDGEQVPVIERLLRPFGFQQAAPGEGMRRWHLSRAAWSATSADGRFAFRPCSG